MFCVLVKFSSTSLGVVAGLGARGLVPMWYSSFGCPSLGPRGVVASVSAIPYIPLVGLLGCWLGWVPWAKYLCGTCSLGSPPVALEAKPLGQKSLTAARKPWTGQSDVGEALGTRRNGEAGGNRHLH